MAELYKLKSGVEVPKPLDFYQVEEMNEETELFYPDFSCFERYSTRLAKHALREMSETSLFYLTEQEAVQATKLIIGE